MDLDFTAMTKLNIQFKESSGIFREKEPVTFGIPFSLGNLKDVSEIIFVDKNGDVLPHGSIVMSRWHDQSVKWLLVDIQITVPSCGKTEIYLKTATGELKNKPSEFLSPTLQMDLDSSSYPDKFIIKTGIAEFVVPKEIFAPFHKIRFMETNMLLSSESICSLIDSNGNECMPKIEFCAVEHDSILRKTIMFQGRLLCSSNKSHNLQFISKLHFFAGKSFVKIDLTIHNPEPACHPNCVWDLGDKRSYYFKDLSVVFTVSSDRNHNGFYTPDILNCAPGSIVVSDSHDVAIYQNSSGGENWRSKNHINAEGVIPLSFKGYRIFEDGAIVSEGLRASPLMGIAGKSGVISAFIPYFWQNFPKSIEFSDNKLRIRLFPGQFNALHELQPGEQKTHTIYVSIEPFSEHASSLTSLKWAADPLLPVIIPEYLYSTSACPIFVPAKLTLEKEECVQYDALINLAISGTHSFAQKREIIDEYGWRNYGDIYADHEAVFSKKGEQFISHYNNQFDVIKGALIQYMRTGKKEWFDLAKEMGDHVSDIDIYHTEKDKYQFNNGMFWHTDHHLDAATATHRTVSEKHRELKPPGLLGGGPAPDHNYATGLLYLYYLTGNTLYRDAVVGLASNITRLIDGTDTLCETLLRLSRTVLRKIRKRGESVAARYNEVFVFDGPGRASGNALNTLMDAWLLTSDDRYLHYAENLILMSVSPEDDFVKMDLLNAELRWMYVIFMQALGRYISIKKNANHIDAYYEYAIKVMIKYAEWMADNEYPYLDKPEILEFPNETWVAQDIRKADIFAYAASIAPEDFKKRFFEKSKFFFEYSVKHLNSYETRHFARPLAIIMANGMPYIEMKYGGINIGKVDCTSSNTLNSVNHGVNIDTINLHSNRKHFIRTLKKSLLQSFSLKKELDWIEMQINTRTYS